MCVALRIVGPRPTCFVRPSKPRRRGGAALRRMQHPATPATPRPPVPPSDVPASRDVSAERAAREMPDAQLWRDAIGAARSAAEAVAELRSAFEASRPAGRG